MVCQKTEGGSSALVKHSDCIGSGLMHLSPGESPLLHSLVFLNLLSLAPALYPCPQCIVFLRAS